MIYFMLRNDNMRDDRSNLLTFNGELIARVSSSPDDKNVLYYSGSNDKWREFRIYRVHDGDYCCQIINFTKESSIKKQLYDAKFCEDHNEIIDFFGDDWMAIELYENAGIDDYIL